MALDNKVKKDDVENPESYIILPGEPDTLISMNRVHLGKNWTQCHEALAVEDSFMPTIRAYVNFLQLLKSGNNIYDGKGNKVDTAKVSAIIEDILAVRAPYRAEWLDADFKVVNGRLHINYNHKKVGKDFKPQNSEPLDSCLREYCFVDIDSANKQGLPTRKSKTQEVYYLGPLEDNNSVARFGAGLDVVFLGCIGDPQHSRSGLGVRRQKFFP